MKQVSAVIPTYNGLNLLKKNLPKVIQALNPNDELLVVDDASSDETVKWLTTEFKLWPDKTHALRENCQLFRGNLVSRQLTVTLVVNQENQRFAASVNLGVKLAENDLIFLLNNDVSPQEDCLDYLLPHFYNDTSQVTKSDDEQTQPPVFGVGCLEIEPNQGHVFGGKNVLEFKRGMFTHARALEFSSGPTAWVSGGSGLFDQTKWLKLGGFDLSFYPAYWEDIDLSFRARKKGWQVLFEKQAVVIHNHESTNQTAFGQQKINQISWRNAVKFTKKHASFWQKLLFYLWRPYWWVKMKTIF